MDLNNLPPVQKLAPVLAVILIASCSIGIFTTSNFAKFLFGFIGGIAFSFLLVFVILGKQSKS
jgi:hypothetical protein